MATGTDTDNALLSAGDAIKYLYGTTATTGDDTTITDVVRDLINVVSWRFNAETGRNLKARAYTSQYDGDGTSELQLKNWPLSSTAVTVTINANRNFTDTDDVATATDIICDTGTGILSYDGDSFTEGTHNIQVEYSAGYSTSDAFDLTYAAKEFLKSLWDRQSGRVNQEVRTEAYEGISRTYDLDFPWSVKKILDMYRDGRAY